MLGTKMQTLLAVVEAQNFTRAAQALSMTQPAVSHHIKQLEEELGAPLFVRSKTGLRLTPQGEIAVKYARRLKALDEKLHLELENAETGRTNLRGIICSRFSWPSVTAPRRARGLPTDMTHTR